MNESDYQALLRTAWRRPLSLEEQARLDAWLATHPQAQAEWEEETGLNRLLGQLPPAPVPSNFTALVLQALEERPTGATRRPSLSTQLRQWFGRPAARIAWALLILSVAVGVYQHRRTNARNELAKGLTVLTQVAALSDPAALQDFEPILRLGQAAPSDDDELFTVLNQ